MLAIFIVPFGLAIGVLIDAASEGIDLVRKLATEGLPPLPSWVAGVPWVGSKLAAKWQELAAGGPEAITSTLRPYVGSTAMVIGHRGLGAVTVHFLLTVAVSAILYSNGDSLEGYSDVRAPYGGERGEVDCLAGQASAEWRSVWL
jgi:predicted PurR-regulated permease PerM